MIFKLKIYTIYNLRFTIFNSILYFVIFDMLNIKYDIKLFYTNVHACHSLYIQFYNFNFIPIPYIKFLKIVPVKHKI